MSLSETEVDHIREHLAHQDLNFVKQGLDLLNLLIVSEKDLQSVLHYEKLDESLNQFILSHAEFPHQVYIAIWSLGALAKFQVKWALNCSILDLRRFKVLQLPDNIGYLCNLTELNLTDLQISSIPEEIGSCLKLERLILAKTAITELPDSIVELCNLKELNIQGTSIQTLPQDLGQLSQLEIVHLRATKIRTLPSSFQHLQSLKKLSCSSLDTGGLLDSSFNAIGSLKMLEELDMSDNHLLKTPQWIFQLPQLIVLNLSSNNIDTIPDDIVKLTNLTDLDYSRNALQKLPISLTQMSTLKCLNLSENALIELPEQIAKLSNLQTLRIHFNQLTSIPQSIHQLPHLQSVDFHENPLSKKRQAELKSYFPESIQLLTTSALVWNYATFILRTSRPGLWFPTMWLYLLPFAGQHIEYDFSFWVGLFFVTLPLNLLVYGWNDLVDEQTDRINPRKDSYLFGARGNRKQQTIVFIAIGILHLLLWPILIVCGGWKMVLLGMGIVLTCFFYNHPTTGWRGRPGLDLLAQIGYLIVPVFAGWINGIPVPDLEVWIYLALFCTQSQLIGEVMDIEPDRLAGRRNTAVVLGRMKTKGLIIGVVLVEVLMLGLIFGDWYFAAGLGAFLLWLLLDALMIFKDNNYVQWQFQLFGIGSNVMAVASMLYILHTGLFKPIL